MSGHMNLETDNLFKCIQAHHSSDTVCLETRLEISSPTTLQIDKTRTRLKSLRFCDGTSGIPSRSQEGSIGSSFLVRLGSRLLESRLEPDDRVAGR